MFINSSQLKFSSIAKLSHLNIVDNKYLFQFSFRFLVKSFESNLVLEGEDSKSNYAPSSSILDDKSARSCVLLCIVFYHPNKSFFSFPFYRSNVFSGVPQGARSGPLSVDLTSNLPEYWDWRLYGAVSQVKDQVVQSQSQSIIYTNLCRKQFQVAHSWRDFPAHNWSLNAITEFINALKFLTLLKC